MNKLIVVTGGTKGIGKAIIEKFSRHDFDIVTCSRNRQELDLLKTTLYKLNPAINVFVRQADLSDKNQTKDFCEFVRALQRPIDVLVNNAGFFLPGQIVTEPEDTLEQMINANVYSAYHTTRGLAAEMINKSVGHIFWWRWYLRSWEQ